MTYRAPLVYVDDDNGARDAVLSGPFPAISCHKPIALATKRWKHFLPFFLFLFVCICCNLRRGYDRSSIIQGTKTQRQRSADIRICTNNYARTRVSTND